MQFLLIFRDQVAQGQDDKRDQESRQEQRAETLKQQKFTLLLSHLRFPPSFSQCVLCYRTTQLRMQQTRSLSVCLSLSCFSRSYRDKSVQR